MASVAYNPPPPQLYRCPTCTHFDCTVCPNSPAFNMAPKANTHRQRIKNWLEGVSASMNTPAKFVPVPEPSLKNSLSLITHHTITPIIPNVTARKNEKPARASRSRSRGATANRRRASSAGLIPEEPRRRHTTDEDHHNHHHHHHAGYRTDLLPREYHASPHPQHHQHPALRHAPKTDDPRLVSPKRLADPPLQQPMPLSPGKAARVLSDTASYTRHMPAGLGSSTAESDVSAVSMGNSVMRPPSTAATDPVVVVVAPPAAAAPQQTDVRIQQLKDYNKIQRAHLQAEGVKEELARNALGRQGIPASDDDFVRDEEDRERERKERILARNRARNEQIRRAMLERRAAAEGGGGAAGGA